MRLRILHETQYDYAPAVQASRHLAHLRPRPTPTQQVLDHSLSIDPQPSQIHEDTDAWGNGCTHFTLQQAHHHLRVIARSHVLTWEPGLPGITLPWEEARGQVPALAGADGPWPFMQGSAYAPCREEFAAYAAISFEPGRDLAEAARHLAGRIHREFEYCTVSTDVSTPALQALALRKGVCQDFAHVMIACLRSLGLAARYVSGYLLTQPPPGQPRLIGCDASHAWVSVYLPGTGAPAASGEPAGRWWDLDPTNNRPAGSDYVTLAFGRDYADVSPLGGVIEGGGHGDLRVAVTVEPDEPLPLQAPGH